MKDGRRGDWPGWKVWVMVVGGKGRRKMGGLGIMGGLHCFKERDFRLGKGNEDKGRIGLIEHCRNRIRAVLPMRKATSFRPFLPINNPSSQDASSVIAMLKENRKLNLYHLSCLFSSQRREKPHQGRLSPSHHQLPIFLPKTRETNAKAHHLIILLASIINTSAHA